MTASAISAGSGRWTGMRFHLKRQKSPERETHRSLMAKLDDSNDEEIQFQKYDPKFADFGD